MINRRYVRYSIYIVFLLIIVWILRLITIFPWKSTKLVYADELKKSELIVDLGGEYYERAEHALTLVEQGYAKIIYAPSLGYEKTRKYFRERLVDI